MSLRWLHWSGLMRYRKCRLNCSIHRWSIQLLFSFSANHRSVQLATIFCLNRIHTWVNWIERHQAKTIAAKQQPSRRSDWKSAAIGTTELRSSFESDSSFQEFVRHVPIRWWDCTSPFSWGCGCRCECGVVLVWVWSLPLHPHLRPPIPLTHAPTRPHSPRKKTPKTEKTTFFF